MRVTGLSRQDKEFRHPGVSYLDYKQIDMDRVLTGFLPRLWWRGAPSKMVGAPADIDVGGFVASFLEYPDRFEHFDEDITYRWIETHLLDLVNRGRPTQAVAGLRPLHGFTYRFRVARRSRPYGADEQLYWMLHYAPGNLGAQTLDYLKHFFFAGVDPRTARPTGGEDIDVETQALIHLSQAEGGSITDRAATERQRAPYPPLDPAVSERLAVDVVKLLAHEPVIPRSVLVDHLKILFAVHLALYHLDLMVTLPARVAAAAGDRAGTGDRVKGGLFVDVAGIPGTPCARLAERSARRWYGRIPAFVQATFTVKKLDDFSRYLATRSAAKRSADAPPSVAHLLELLGPRHRAAREQFGAIGLDRVLTALRGPDDDLDPQTADLVALGLDPFTTYIEVVTAQRVAFHRKYLTECLDTLLLKSRPGALVTQPRRGERRFVLDSRLVEVLLQLALLGNDRQGALRTVPLRVDEFLTVLKSRYGLFIDEFPPGDDLGRPGIAERAALRENRVAFVDRLREIGFYADLSDAFITQTITPRYRLGGGTA
jgi:hypothetical protein